MHKPDGLIADDVRDALDWDNAVDDARIMVQVKDGKVTLTGAVHTYPEALKAVEDTKHLKGVRDIDNQLLVGPAGEAVTTRYCSRPATRRWMGTRSCRRVLCRYGARRLGHPRR